MDGWVHAFWSLEEAGLEKVIENSLHNTGFNSQVADTATALKLKWDEVSRGPRNEQEVRGKQRKSCQED